jgi:hypothetical protein
LKGGPQRGSVPGIKRHVGMVHGKEAYAKLERRGVFGSLYDGEEPKKSAPSKKTSRKKTSRKRKTTKRKPATVKTSSNGHLDEQPIDDLRKLARAKGINPSGLRKTELVAKLS